MTRYESPSSLSSVVVTNIEELVLNCNTFAWLKISHLDTDVLNYLRNPSGQRIAQTSINVSSNNFDIYPNPSSNNITLNSKVKLQNYSVEIFNSMGQVIQGKTNVNSSNSSISFDINKYNSGMYYMKVQTPTELLNLPFIKQ